MANARIASFFIILFICYYLASSPAKPKPAHRLASGIGRMAYGEYSVQLNKSAQQDFLHFVAWRPSDITCDLPAFPPTS
jgi:hypothetical protein